MSKHIETFVIYMTSFDFSLIHLVRQPQIALLLIKEVTILDKYSDFINVFSEEKISELPE